MSVARLSTKGQVVIPQALRQRLGLQAGDLFEVTVRDGALVLRPAVARPPPTTLDEVVGMLGGGPTLTPAEMDRAVDDELRRRWSAT